MSFMIIPKSRKTIDPKYKDAKKCLRSYQVSCDKYRQSMKNLSTLVLQVSKAYSKLSTTVTCWYPDSTPAVRQSMDSITKSAANFEQMTADNFVNKVNESFDPAMEEYQKHVNALLTLEKKRRSAVKEYDRDREKLRQAESAKNPDQNKIDHAQTQVDATGETYNKLNDEYISSVEQFGEERKSTLLTTFKKCCAALCAYINQVTAINFVPFPEDINSSPKNNQLQKDLDSIKVLDSNNTFPNQNSEQITQSVSISNMNSASPANTNPPSPVGRLNSTPSPAAKRLSRRISDCEYQQKRKSSSIAQPITPTSYADQNSESIATTTNQTQQPKPEQVPKPAQAPKPSPAPIPKPVQQPTPAPVPQPTPAPVQQPTPAPVPQPTPAPVQQPTPAAGQESETSESYYSESSKTSTNPNQSTNNTALQSQSPSIPNGSNAPAAPTSSMNNAEPWYSSKANIDTEWHAQSSTEVNNKDLNTADNSQSGDDDTYSHVNPFGSGDENDEDKDYTRENPFN